MLKQPLDFTDCSRTQFFNFFPSPSTVSEAAQVNPPVNVQHLCDVRNAIPFHWSPSASHSNPYLGKQRISLEVGES